MTEFLNSVQTLLDEIQQNFFESLSVKYIRTQNTIFCALKVDKLDECYEVLHIFNITHFKDDNAHIMRYNDDTCLIEQMTEKTLLEFLNSFFEYEWD